MTNDNLYADVGRILRKLQIRDPYYGTFMMSLDKQETTAVPTLAVGLDGINVKLLINKEFWNKHSDEHKFGVCKHEVLHLCHMHLITSDAYPQHKIDNIACDAEINQYIKPEYLPEGGITLESVEKWFGVKLEPKQGRDVYYKQLMQKAKEEIENFILGDAEHYWDQLTEKLSEAEKQAVGNQIGHLMQQTAESVLKSQGTIPGEIQGLLELMKKPPVFDWKKHVRRWAGNSDRIYFKSTRFKPNPYFPGTPSSKFKMKGNILCAIDTSGSVSENELHEFMSEIYHLWKTGHVITIMCADTKLYDPYEYKGGNKIQIHGRGGTYFSPVLEYFNKESKYSAMIYFTDGYAELPPNANKPMLWVISSGGSDNAIKEHNGKKLLIKQHE